MALSLDHIVILVSDLATATADYTTLGFTVTPGGEHQDGSTHNALVAFADGCYLELIAFKRPSPGHFWWRHVAQGGGMIDFALVPDDIRAVIEGAASRGLPLHGPMPGGRLRPDGERLEWQSGRASSADLPFLCADVTPRSLRVPHGPASVHPNGVEGVRQLVVAVADLETSLQRYDALLGGSARIPGAPVPEALQGADHVSVELGGATITLAAPGSNRMLQAQLDSRGEGPCALVLAGPNHAFDVARTHGVALGSTSRK